MTASETPEQRRQRAIASFDAIAAGYEGLRFVHGCARRLIELATPSEGTHLLDVGTGTGLVALAVAPTVGPTGSVIGLDFSAEMLAQAQAKLEQTELGNVTFVQGDAQALPFPDQSFDTVLCASVLFFVPDMQQATREFHRVLKPGGLVGFTSFGVGFLQPLMEIWAARLQAHGVPTGTPPVERLAAMDTCRALLEQAGFANVTVQTEQLGYHHARFSDRWAEIRTGLEGMPLNRFTPEERAQIEAEHRAELQPLFTPDGLWTSVPSNFAFGTRV